jgi:uncharacterized protein (DUF302 family)
MNVPYDTATERVVAALKEQGFGVLTRIDVKATLKEKLGEDFRPYVIMGACNPPLAHQALTADPSVGLMLPCNVTVEAKSRDISLVRIADPAMMMQAASLQDNIDLQEVAVQARAKLEKVAQNLT